jgi:hypothetical protein
MKISLIFNYNNQSVTFSAYEMLRATHDVMEGFKTEANTSNSDSSSTSSPIDKSKGKAFNPHQIGGRSVDWIKAANNLKGNENWKKDNNSNDSIKNTPIEFYEIGNRLIGIFSPGSRFAWDYGLASTIKNLYVDKNLEIGNQIKSYLSLCGVPDKDFEDINENEDLLKNMQEMERQLELLEPHRTNCDFTDEEIESLAKVLEDILVIISSACSHIQKFAEIEETYEKSKDPKAAYIPLYDQLNKACESDSSFNKNESIESIKSLLKKESGSLSDDKKVIAVLTAAWFLSETSRNSLTFLTSLMLLDMMQSNKTYGSKGKTYEWANVLWDPISLKDKQLKIRLGTEEAKLEEEKRERLETAKIAIIKVLQTVEADQKAKATEAAKEAIAALGRSIRLLNEEKKRLETAVKEEKARLVEEAKAQLVKIEKVANVTESIVLEAEKAVRIAEAVQNLTRAEKTARDERGGKHPMCNNGSYIKKILKEDKNISNLLDKNSGKLNTVREKEATLIIQWLHHRLSKSNPELITTMRQSGRDKRDKKDGTFLYSNYGIKPEPSEYKFTPLQEELLNNFIKPQLKERLDKFDNLL